MEIANIKNELKYENVIIRETESFFSIEIKILKYKNSVNSVCDFFNLKKGDDEISISVSLYGEDPIYASENSDNADLYDFFFVGNDEYDLNIYITKKKSFRDGIIQVNVYDVENFINYLTQKKIENLYKCFSNLYNDCCNYIYFQSKENIIIETLSFSVSDSYDYDQERLNRLNKLKFLKENLNYNGDIQINVLPEDFDIVYKRNISLNLKYFEEARNLLSIIYIADNSYLKDEKLFFSILGKSYVYNFGEYNSIYFTLYKWIFENENYYDKLLLTKNIMSGMDINQFDDQLLCVIHNNYRLLQKKNIDKYFELKIEVGNSILNNSKQFEDIEKIIFGTFYKNIVGFFGFLFTVVIANASIENDLNNIFTPDIVSIMYILFLASVGILFITKYQCKKEIERINNDYFKLKNNYADVFMDEVENLFNINDFNEQKNKAINRIKYLTIIWIVIIFCCFIGVEFFLNKLNFLNKIIDFIVECIKCL